MMEPDEEQEKFSDDPEEQLKMENEILKLKLNAELGGKFESLAEIPAEIENLFLKNVLAFEHEHSKAEIKTVYDVLERPDFTPASQLNDQQVEAELQWLSNLMEEKSIVVDYLVEYPARTKYTFLTEELFQHASSLFTMPGMTTHYMYEEFHPNYDYDIKRRCNDFMRHWFEKDLEGLELDLNIIMTMDAAELKKEQVLSRLQMAFDSYDEFIDTEVELQDVNFTLYESEDETAGTGTADGVVSYKAVLEDGETVSIEGSFSFSLIMLDNYWNITGFSLPGFTW